MTIDQLEKDLWSYYIQSNPKIQAVIDLIGSDHLNDHIAFRTIKYKKFSVSEFKKIFFSLGYEEKDSYYFEDKKIDAIHLEKDNAPKIFLSELLIDEFSSESQVIIKNTLDQLTFFPSDVSILTKGAPWDKSHKDYLTLTKESQYAAWVYTRGFCPNHFTINLNSLEKFHSLEELNSFLKSHNILINDSGGEVKGSPKRFLEQSSTKSFKSEVLFFDEAFEVPNCYIEFIKRYKMSDGKIFNGFLTSSANNIFESTNIK